MTELYDNYTNDFGSSGFDTPSSEPLDKIPRKIFPVSTQNKDNRRQAISTSLV
jgi:hypothetical protein